MISWERRQESGYSITKFHSNLFICNYTIFHSHQPLLSYTSGSYLLFSSFLYRLFLSLCSLFSSSLLWNIVNSLCFNRGSHSTKNVYIPQLFCNKNAMREFVSEISSSLTSASSSASFSVVYIQTLQVTTLHFSYLNNIKYLQNVFS